MTAMPKQNARAYARALPEHDALAYATDGRTNVLTQKNSTNAESCGFVTRAGGQTFSPLIGEVRSAFGARSVVGGTP